MPVERLACALGCKVLFCTVYAYLGKSLVLLPSTGTEPRSTFPLRSVRAVACRCTRSNSGRRDPHQLPSAGPLAGSVPQEAR